MAPGVRAALLALGLLALAPGAARAELACAAIREFSAAYLRHHVRFNELNEDLEARTIDTYLQRLDPSRTLLTQPEVEEVRAELKGIFGKLEAGHCDPLLDLHRLMIRHHEAAAKDVRRIVSPDSYEIDTSASLVLDPEERGYPKDDAARKDLLRRMVHFQMSNYLSNDTELAEAKRKLIARYERRFKRYLEIEPQEIYSDFLDAFATSLDPHSNYLSAQVLEDFRIGMSLSLEGIGVALSEQDGYAVAERIIPGGAAAANGKLRPKDKLIAVAQEGGEFVDIIDMPLRDAVALIRGKAGTKVGLTVLRQGEKTEKFNIEIVRDKIDLAEQAAKLRFEEVERSGKTYKLAVLELPSFYGDSDPSKRQCTDDVARLLRQVNKEKADGLLLDLSRNGGGLLQHAVTISGFFISRGEIVGIEDARGLRQILADRDDDVLYSGPMVVLTSRVSASASEILAGALKDYGRAVIVGDDHTFGKGTVQTVSQLPDDQGALKITTALFFRPGGHSTQHAGVSADVVLPSVLASDDYGEKTQRYSLPPQETTPFLSDSANSPLASEHWQPVSKEVVARLAAQSDARVKQSDVFHEILEQLEEARENDGTVVVSEIMKQREEAALAEAGSAEEAATAPEQAPAADGQAKASDAPETAGQGAVAVGEETEEPTPQLVEALHVLSDLVALDEKLAPRQDVAHGASPPPS